MGDAPAAPERGADPAPRPEIACLGEAMVLVAPPADTRLREAERAELRVAGAESNTAQYLADLGHDVAWVSRLGQDPLGDRVAAEIAGSGVDVRAVHRDPARPTAVYFKDPAPDGTAVHYYRAGSAASRLGPADLDRVDFAAIRLAYTSGVTVALSGSCAETVTAFFDRAAAAGAVRAFDVNHRPRLWPDGTAPAALLEVARRAEVVFVGLDEAADLWGTATPDEVRDRLPEPARLVVKDAAVGATAFDGTDRHFEPAEHVDVVEAVGAGDAFAAGYLSALLRGAGPAARLRLGHRVAALALGSVADHVDARGLRGAVEVGS